MSAKCLAEVAIAAMVLAQLGSGTPLQRSLDKLERSVTRPVPQAPTPPTARAGDVWVPDRYVSDPADGRLITVPGHWERRLPSGETYAPPITICGSTGCTTLPAGVRPPPEQRQAP